MTDSMSKLTLENKRLSNTLKRHIFIPSFSVALCATLKEVRLSKLMTKNFSLTIADLNTG